jgi:valyl-tRNA synthetase
VRHPFFPEREVSIVLDSVLVDMTLGTGAVKITPAHDPNDYECGVRHNLPFITVITPTGAISAEGGERFAGLMRYDARIEVEAALKEVGLFRDKYPKAMRLGRCQRSGDIIEPLVQPQWCVPPSSSRRGCCCRVGRWCVRPPAVRLLVRCASLPFLRRDHLITVVVSSGGREEAFPARCALSEDDSTIL